ncbi:hypothetical protein GCM10020218_093270 [Dactylosporangium vinaceum]
MSAIGEAIERYAGVWRGEQPVTRARFAETAHAVHPRDLLLFSEEQYDRREPRGHFHRVPRRLNRGPRDRLTQACVADHDERGGCRPPTAGTATPISPTPTCAGRLQRLRGRGEPSGSMSCRDCAS